MKSLVSFVLLLAIVIFGLSFAAINSDPVTVNYYIGTIEMPLALVLAAVFGAGALFGVLVCVGPIMRRSREASRLRKKADVAEREVRNLRALPLKETG